MQTSTLSSGSRSSSEIVLFFGGICVFGATFFFFTHGLLNLLFAVLIAAVLLMLSLVDKARAAMLTIAYLILMGDLRRILTPFTGIQKLDTLLVIGPAVACFLALPILLKVKLADRLSKVMFAITVIMVLEIFYPRQGGVAVGLTGVIFNLAPILWFWVGRRYATDRVIETFLYKVLLPLGIAAVMLGMYQTYVGFLPFEQAWIDAVRFKGYTSLVVAGNKSRPFGFSVSAAEYANLLSIAGAAAFATWWGRRRIWAFLFPLFGAGVLLSSGRTVFVKFIVALALVFIIRKGRRLTAATLLRLSFASVAALLLLNVGASLLPSADVSEQAKQSSAEQAFEHQASGLAHPLDAKYSTAGMHGGMFVAGILEGFRSPLGSGLGSTSAAASKYGTSGTAANSEVDISDMFGALGFIGGFAYLYMVLAVMRSLFIYTSTVPRTIGLPVAAILVTTLGAWLIGAQYSTAAIIFFLIGGIVKSDLALQRAAQWKPTRQAAPLAARPAAMAPLKGLS